MFDKQTNHNLINTVNHEYHSRQYGLRKTIHKRNRKLKHEIK